MIANKLPNMYASEICCPFSHKNKISFRLNAIYTYLNATICIYECS